MKFRALVLFFLLACLLVGIFCCSLWLAGRPGVGASAAPPLPATPTPPLAGVDVPASFTVR